MSVHKIDLSFSVVDVSDCLMDDSVCPIDVSVRLVDDSVRHVDVSVRVVVVSVRLVDVSVRVIDDVVEAYRVVHGADGVDEVRSVSKCETHGEENGTFNVVHAAEGHVHDAHGDVLVADGYFQSDEKEVYYEWT